MNINAQDLINVALNWAVAKAHGENPVVENGVVYSLKTIAYREYKFVWEPATNWGQGGPIIEREGIALWPDVEGGWHGECNTGHFHNRQSGPTPLVAAMRCYVASKLGNEIEVPDEVTA